MGVWLASPLCIVLTNGACSNAWAQSSHMVPRCKRGINEYLHISTQFCNVLAFIMGGQIVVRHLINSTKVEVWWSAAVGPLLCLCPWCCVRALLSCMLISSSLSSSESHTPSTELQHTGLSLISTCGRALNRELYAQKLQTWIHLHLSTDCFMKISLQSRLELSFFYVLDAKNHHKSILILTKGT